MEQTACSVHPVRQRHQIVVLTQFEFMILNIRTFTTYSHIICQHWFANFTMLRLFRNTALFRMSLLFRDADQNFGMIRKKRDGWQPHFTILVMHLSSVNGRSKVESE